MMKELQVSLNQTQRVRLQAALQHLSDLASQASSSNLLVSVSDNIPVNNEDGILKGHGTSELDSKVVATLCGAVERVNKLVYVRALRARYKPEVGDIIVGRVIEIAPKRWRLEINFSQDAVLMLQSMNLPDGIQRRRTAVDELNMRSIFEENDVVCAEVRGFQHDGSLHLQARSQKYGKLCASCMSDGKSSCQKNWLPSLPAVRRSWAKLSLKLERGQLLRVPPYLVKRRKQHFYELEQYGVDLILGCNGFIWVGEHVVPVPGENAVVGDGESMVEDEERSFTPLEIRRHICRIANSVRLLATLGFALSVEAILDTAEASRSSNVELKDMLGAEFYVQTAEREVQRRVSLMKKKRG